MAAKQSRMQGSAQLSSGLFAVCARSVLPALAIAVLLLFLSAAFAYAQADPGKLALPLALSSLFLSALSCGFIAARLSAGNPLSAGALSGTLFLLLITALSFLPAGSGGTGFAPLLSAAVHAAVIAAAVLGAILGRKRKRRSAARKKRRR